MVVWGSRYTYIQYIHHIYIYGIHMTSWLYIYCQFISWHFSNPQFFFSLVKAPLIWPAFWTWNPFPYTASIMHLQKASFFEPPKLMWVLNQKYGENPQIIHFNRVFHEIFTIHFGVFPPTHVWNCCFLVVTCSWVVSQFRIFVIFIHLQRHRTAPSQNFTNDSIVATSY